MADDPSLETEISGITDQIKELLKERNELGPLDVRSVEESSHRIKPRAIAAARAGRLSVNGVGCLIHRYRIVPAPGRPSRGCALSRVGVKCA